MLLLKSHIEALRGGGNRRLLKQLELMGLYDNGPTKAGELVLEAAEKVGEIEVERRFGSETAQMIYASLEADYVIEPRRDYLSKRGFAEGSRLTEAAKLVYHAYQIAIPKIEIYDKDVPYILSLPTGPTEVSEMRPKEIVYALEAMKMLAISPPMKKTIASLTAIGRLIRLALRDMFVVEGKLIDEEIMYAAYALLKGYPVSEGILKRLEELGLYKRGLTIAGRRLGRAYEILRYPKLYESPIAISSVEMRTIKAIKELREKYEKNPEIYPNKKTLSKALEIDTETLSKILYTLEALEIIYSEEHPRKEDVRYLLTENGKAILEDIEKNGIRDVRAYAVKAVMYSFSKRAPIYERYEEALKARLVSKLAVTKSGLLYLKLSKNIRRSPLVTREEAEIIRKIPSRGAFIDEISTLEALDKLEAKGFVDILPNGFVKLTEAGRLAQIALLKTPTDLAFPINPLLVRVLKAAYEIGSLDEDYIRKATRLPREEIKKALVIIRSAGYRGKSGITDKGKALLRIVTEFYERLRLSEGLSKEQESIERAFYANT